MLDSGNLCFHNYLKIKRQHSFPPFPCHIYAKVFPDPLETAWKVFLRDILKSSIRLLSPQGRSLAFVAQPEAPRY